MTIIEVGVVKNTISAKEGMVSRDEGVVSNTASKDGETIVKTVGVVTSGMGVVCNPESDSVTETRGVASISKASCDETDKTCEMGVVIREEMGVVM